MMERFARAVAELRSFALRFGIAWVVLMACIVGAYTWVGRIPIHNLPVAIAAAAAGYLVILAGVFLIYFVFSKRSPP